MSHGRYELTFTNRTSKKLYVAYMRREPVCLDDCGEEWDVRGWIALDPGETETRLNPTKNQWFYIYAEGDGFIYNGPYTAEVTDAQFAKCTCLGTTSPLWYTVGFLEIDTVRDPGFTFT
jgi:hypothetical protein